jgi:hypothetical protein
MSFLYYILHEDPQSLMYKFFETQLARRNQKDWVSTVLKDIEELDLNLNFDDIKCMKKSSFTDMVKRSIEEKTLEYLNQKKASHTKVLQLKHTNLKMKRYFLPSEAKQKKEESQLIFKLRSKMTDLKMNFKGIYDSYECEACGLEDESQDHILKCKEILKISKEEDKIPNHERLFEGTVQEQVSIARIFKKHIEIKEKIIQNEK